MRVCLVFVMGKPSVLTGIQSMRKSLGVGGFIARRPASFSCQLGRVSRNSSLLGL